MSAPYAAMAAAVDIVQAGALLQARDRASGVVLGTAHRCCEAGEPIGWLVIVGAYREVVATVTTARFSLLNAASKLAGAR